MRPPGRLKGTRGSAALNVSGSGRRGEAGEGERRRSQEQEDLSEQGTLGVGVDGVCLSEMGEVTAWKLLRGQGEVTRTHWVWRIGITGDLCQRVLKLDAFGLKSEGYMRKECSMSASGYIFEELERYANPEGFAFLGEQ